MKECSVNCSVNSLETLYTVIAELLMPDNFFRYWTEKNAESKTTLTVDKLVELLQQYRLRCHDGNHPLYLCAVYKAKSVEDRFSTASRLKVCTNCLSFNHSCRDCSSRSCCRVCGKRHHSLLHRSRPSTQTTNESATTERQTVSTSTNAQTPSTTNVHASPFSTNAHPAPSSNTTRGEVRQAGTSV